MKYLIIGGVAGGATVAARLRRRDEQATIVLFERGKYVSYANCGLPYYVGGVIAERDKLFVQTVQGFTERFRVDIRTEQEVTAIDRAAAHAALPASSMLFCRVMLRLLRACATALMVFR